MVGIFVIRVFPDISKTYGDVDVIALPTCSWFSEKEDAGADRLGVVTSPSDPTNTRPPIDETVDAFANRLPFRKSRFPPLISRNPLIYVFPNPLAGVVADNQVPLMFSVFCFLYYGDNFTPSPKKSFGFFSSYKFR